MWYIQFFFFKFFWKWVNKVIFQNICYYNSWTLVLLIMVKFNSELLTKYSTTMVNSFILPVIGCEFFSIFQVWSLWIQCISINSQRRRCINHILIIVGTKEPARSSPSLSFGRFINHDKRELLLEEILSFVIILMFYVSRFTTI